MVFGYGALGAAAIDTLDAMGMPIAAVVVPGNRDGSAVRLVGDAARARDLPVWVQPRRQEIEPFLARVRAAAPDVILVWSYSMRLPEPLLEIPPAGAVNVHSGLLPEYRGGHVVQWAILNGEPEIGATLHYMDAGIDTGPVIATATFPIGDSDDAVSVTEKLKDAGARLLREWWPGILARTAPRVRQDEARARHWPMRSLEEGRIAWTMPRGQIARMVRALAGNAPGAYVEVNGRRVSLRRVELGAAGTPSSPGKVLSIDAGGVAMAAVDGVLVISAATYEGRAVSGQALAELLVPMP